MASGEKANTWGDITNNNLGTLLEEAICGYIEVMVSDTVDTVLNNADWVSNEARNAVIHLIGTTTSIRTIIAPQAPKVYIIKNDTSGGYNVVFKRAGGVGITIPNDKTVILYYNSITTDFEQIVPYYADLAQNLSGGIAWNTAGRINSVANMLTWSDGGDNHVVFDASDGNAPDLTPVNNENSATAWQAGYPTLMGWNGTSTYGVRVDSARLANTSSACSGNAATATTATNTAGGTIYGTLVSTGGTIYAAGTINSGSSIQADTSVRANTTLIAGSNIKGEHWGGGGSTDCWIQDQGLLYRNSDSSLKQEDLTASIPGLAELLQLQPKAYKWLWDIEARGADAVTEVGFFADQVAPIIPSAAPKDKDGLYGFFSRPIIAALVNAVKEQQVMINTLTDRITALEAK
jgi:hypothetical protein